MLTAFSLAAPSPTTAAPSPTTVTWGKEPMRLSSTGPESTLPTFMFMSGAEEGGDIFAGFNFSGGRALSARVYRTSDSETPHTEATPR